MHDEQQMLQAFCDGDFSQTDALIRQHEDNLYTLCCKLARSRQDADDLYQQTWLRAVGRSHTFAMGSFKSWLYTICVNVYRDNYRRQKRREHIDGDSANGEVKEYLLNNASDRVSAEGAALKNIEAQALLSRIDDLPDKHRLPIILHYFEGLGYVESAQALGIPVGTVKSRLSYAKRRLRKEMEKDSDD